MMRLKKLDVSRVIEAFYNNDHAARHLHICISLLLARHTKILEKWLVEGLNYDDFKPLSLQQHSR